MTTIQSDNYYIFLIIFIAAMELGVGVEHFLPIPKPPVRLLGAAVNAGGHPLANIVEISASKVHYLVVVELPQVLYCDSKSRFV